MMIEFEPASIDLPFIYIRIISSKLFLIYIRRISSKIFKFNVSYRQKMGTAMGSSMALAYASLFMGKFEMDFMKICSENQHFG